MTIWVPQKPDPKKDDIIRILMLLARQGSNPALMELEKIVALKHHQQPYVLSLIQQVLPDQDFFITTGPDVFGGSNRIEHHFTTGELYELTRPYVMQRVKAVEAALRDLYDLE